MQTDGKFWKNSYIEWNIPGLQYLWTLSVPAPVRWLPGLHLRADVLPREYQHDGGLKLIYLLSFLSSL